MSQLINYFLAIFNQRIADIEAENRQLADTVARLEERNDTLRKMLDGSYRKRNDLESELNDALMEIRRLNDKMRKRSTPRQWPVRFRN